MEYRVTVREVMQTLASWDAVLPGRGKIHLIACGGTALSLLGYKESTKDVDLLVPDVKEYERLTDFLIRAGYGRITGYGWKRPEDTIIYDLYPGKRVYQTELLSSPLENHGNKKVEEWRKIYLGVLNSVDLMITKLFRGEGQDVEDCLTLLGHEDIDLRTLKERYEETARYDISQERVMRHLELFLAEVKRADVERSEQQ